MRVLYHYYSSLQNGPFKYIDSGYINALRERGDVVCIWDGNSSDKLVNILQEFRPELFIGYLRKPGKYKNYEWMDEQGVDQLVNYRKRYSLKTAFFCNPDVKTIFSNMPLVFQENDVSKASGFYSQPVPPTEEEQVLLDNRLIDTILHCYSKDLTKKGFNYWLQKDVPVLELPLAADHTIYKPSILKKANIQINSLLYVGGWWPFKGQQLDLYIKPLKKRFGKKLKVYGQGWPYLKTRAISDLSFKYKMALYNINLVFHEPSQVTTIPIHVNERIFKLYASGCFALCDGNPCLKEYFQDDEIEICPNPDVMLEKAEFYLRNPRQVETIRIKGHKAVLGKHTYSHRVDALLKHLQ